MNKNNILNIFPDDEENDRISTEKLNEYMRFGSAGGYILIGALIIAIISLLIWGFTGTIQITISEAGIVSEMESDSHICLSFVDIDENTGIIPEGKAVSIRMPDGKTVPGTLGFFSTVPYSAEELRRTYSSEETYAERTSAFSDWVMDKLLDGCNYAYLIRIDTQEDISDYWHQLVQLTIVMDEVRPISFLLR